MFCHIRISDNRSYSMSCRLYLLSVRKQRVEHYTFNCPPLLHVSAIFGKHQLLFIQGHRKKWTGFETAIT
jgi:hypothetical protein